MTDVKCSASATIATSASLSVYYLDSLTFMNCGLIFYSCISEAFFFAFLSFFISHIGVYFTFLQVGDEVSDALSMGKEDYFIAMTHTTHCYLFR